MLGSLGRLSYPILIASLASSMACGEVAKSDPDAAVASDPDAPTSASLTVVVAGTGTGAGVVTSAPAGIDCGSDCDESFTVGTEVTLTATPASGSMFDGWTGACSGTGTCVLTLAADETVTATFSPIPATQYTLTVTPAGDGTGTVSSTPAGIDCGVTCSASFDEGTDVVLAASAPSDSRFTGWSGGGCSGTAGCTVTLTENTEVTASFEACPQGPATFDYTGTIVTWTVPACVSSIRIDARGAQGGDGGALGGVGGLGARIQGTFAVTPGDELTILVGGQGQAGTDSGQQAGGTGGGGTFVVDAANQPMVVAGGGGGAMGRMSLVVDGGPGQAGNNGAAGNTNGGAGGTGGGGGTTWPWTGWHSGTGGGGFSGDGVNDSNGNDAYGTINTVGKAFLNGGAGGTGGSLGRDGGFGGGGSAGFTGAGGGGYSGGGSGTHDAPANPNGGGGGSFNGGTSPVNTAGDNRGPGQVVITW